MNRRRLTWSDTKTRNVVGFELPSLVMSSATAMVARRRMGRVYNTKWRQDVSTIDETTHYTVSCIARWSLVSSRLVFAYRPSRDCWLRLTCLLATELQLLNWRDPPFSLSTCQIDANSLSDFSDFYPISHVSRSAVLFFHLPLLSAPTT